ncbi:MAG: TadE/TadG family type IV pilus assembly protein [Bacillota bacterium]
MAKNIGESGQTLVEFALVVPLLLLLVFGTIEFGRIFHAQLVVTSAAQEGARKAAVTGNENDIKETIKNAAAALNITTVELQTDLTKIKNKTNYPDPGKMWYLVNYPVKGTRDYGDPVEVYVKGRVDVLVPIISNLIGSVKPLPAMAVMRVEYDA